jgi:endonuclease/exonuclease/phosphatase family metal-dependent hydrolase
MLTSSASIRLQCASALSLLTLALACDRVKRETTDRFVDHEPSTWTSRSDCEALLSERTESRQNPRLGTWNVRYFPDSQEQTQTDADQATDVPWLACAIASLDVDVLAVQEFKTTDTAIVKQQELVQRLNELTGGNWQLELAPCDPAEVQHPGFLYDANRVTGTQFREIPVLNPDPVCSNNASPGFAGYFSVNGGPDFHFIAVHLQAGDTAGAIERRDYSLGVLQPVVDEAMSLVADTDIFFAGDFNTSGCNDCDPPVSNADEVQQLAETVSAMSTPFQLVGASQSCSRQVDDNPPLLDHFVVAGSAAEVPTDSVAHVSGICEEIECGRLREWLEDARDRLSDHCPVTLDLAAQDDD